MYGASGRRGRFLRQRRWAGQGQGQGTTRGKNNENWREQLLSASAVQHNGRQWRPKQSQAKTGFQGLGGGPRPGHMGIRLSSMAFFEISIRRCIADGDVGWAKLGGMPMANWHTGGIGNRIGMIYFPPQEEKHRDRLRARPKQHNNRDSAPARGKHSLSSLSSSLFSGLFSGLLLDVQRAE
jgi:hypothetical protein